LKGLFKCIHFIRGENHHLGPSLLSKGTLKHLFSSQALTFVFPSNLRPSIDSILANGASYKHRGTDFEVGLSIRSCELFVTTLKRALP
jgi:hypothetical protein